MSARVLVLLGTMVLLGTAGSVLLENKSGAGTSNEAAGDSWRAPAAPVNYFNSGDRFLSALSTGRLFPNTQPRISAAEAAARETAAQEDTGPTIFPTLISISRRDNTFIATVEFEDGQQASVEEGDLLVDEWTVADLSRDALVARLDSDLIRIPLFGIDD